MEASDEGPATAVWAFACAKAIGARDVNPPGRAKMNWLIPPPHYARRPAFLLPLLQPVGETLTVPIQLSFFCQAPSIAAALTASLGVKKAFDSSRTRSSQAAAAKAAQPAAVRLPPTMGAARGPVPEPLDPLEWYD